MKLIISLLLCHTAMANFINIYKETTFYSNLSRLFLTIGILSIVDTFGAFFGPIFGIFVV